MWSMECSYALHRRLSNLEWDAVGQNRDRSPFHFCSSRLYRTPSEITLSTGSLARGTPAPRLIASSASDTTGIYSLNLSQGGDRVAESLAESIPASGSSSSVLRQLADNQFSDSDASLPSGLQELFSSLRLQFSDAFNKLDSEIEVKKLADSFSSYLSEYFTTPNYQDKLRKLVTSLSKPLSDATSKLQQEDFNQLPGQLFDQINEKQEAFIRANAELLQQAQGSLMYAVSKLGPPSMKSIEILKSYSSDAPFELEDVRVLLSDALARLNNVFEHPEDFQKQIEQVLSYTDNTLISLSDMISHLPDKLSFNQGVLDESNSSVSYNTIILALSICSALVLLASLRTSKTSRFNRLDVGDLPSRYDPDAIESYFSNRQWDVYLRLLQVLYEFSSFAASLFIDKAAGLEKENEKTRARELVSLIAKLGPTSIKIGQALSIRPDILPVTYLEELQNLQDKVPPFPNKEAEKLIQDGIGRSIEDIFSEFSSEPVAAASLGQVYKAKLRESGDIVAVKVQRPGVLEGICRDLYILRIVARFAQSLPNVRSNLVALLDTWALRFFDELDYIREGENAIQFATDMKNLPNIIVPAVYMQYTSRKVLITQWVEGEKLSESKAEVSLQLVKVALNCYLIQLLESGFLHADPHPGNLLRTQNGSLCVLDYGLMTQITLDQRYAFIDYISHLVNNDYGLVAEDLVNLGFVPPELVDPEKTVAVVPQLSRVLGQLTQGGGARKVNFQQVIEDLSDMSKDYVFVIPPYFALILRAFSVLEGIGLAADPDYAIVEDCYPYLCKRLLTDDSPRAREALKYFVYAGEEQLDVTRVEELINGFQTFQSLTTITKSESGNNNRLPKTPVDLASKQVLSLIFSPNGSYLQDILLTELVRAVDALSRDAVADIWQYFASRALVSLPPALMAPKSWPVPLPGLFFGSSRVATLSREDEKSLEAVKRIWVLLEPQFIQRPSRLELRQAANDILPLIPDLFPGVVNTGQKFILMLLQRQALRLADDLDGKRSITEWDKDPSAFARKIRPLLRGS